MIYTPCVTDGTDNNDKTEPVAEDDSAEQEPESIEPRRSNREKHKPRKFTYNELGVPVILVANSDVSTSGVRCACRDSCILEGENVTPGY